MHWKTSLLAVVFLGLVLAGCSEQHSPQPAAPAFHGYSSQRINLNGLDFRYLEAGEGELVLLLHGFPYTADVWYKQMDALSPDYRVVALDQRGYGYSAKPAEVDDYRLENLVEDARLMIERLSVSGNAIVVGHDWGGAVAWALAQRYPEVVSKLVVINAPPPNVLLHVLQSSEKQREASRYMWLLKSPLTPHYIALRGAGVFWGDSTESMQAKGHIDAAFREAYLEAWRQPGAPAAALKWYRANIPEFDEIDDSHFWPGKNARVTVPGLLIWSRDDVAFVEDALLVTQDFVDDLAVKLIVTKSHAPFLDEHASEVNQGIMEFLLNTGSR